MPEHQVQRFEIVPVCPCWRPRRAAESRSLDTREGLGLAARNTAPRSAQERGCPLRDRDRAWHASREPVLSRLAVEALRAGRE